MDTPSMCAWLLLASDRMRIILMEGLQRADCRDGAFNSALACVHICLQLVGRWRSDAGAVLCAEGMGALLLRSMVKQCWEQLAVSGAGMLLLGAAVVC
jgi:hypothetical protein